LGHVASNGEKRGTMTEYEYQPEDFVDVDARDGVSEWSKSEKWVGCQVWLSTCDGKQLRFVVVDTRKREVDNVVLLEGRREDPPPMYSSPGSALFEPRHVEKLWEERKRS
jgi:hypothetical protein